MRPSLLILSGLPFSGKSTLAKYLSEALGVKILSYDHDIYALHKDEVLPGTSKAQEYEQIEAIARRELKRLLQNGTSVIYDDLCLERSDRQILVELAHACQAKPIIVFINTPTSVIRQRRKANLQLKGRDHISETKLMHDKSLLQVPDPTEDAIIYTPDQSLDELVQGIQARLLQNR
ncbi:MAG TPA: ATP-binding protein [Candidatus Saccharimonadales bacterium]|nr:ATP-binding protein [Candidatus Saccharimonadales bacterium]